MTTPDSSPPPATAGAPPPLGAPAPRVGQRVLVVEDSATQAAALAALLEEHGYETVVARDGHEALARVAEGRFDLVLSDIVMPGPSGYEVCRRIKEELGRRDLPVVLLTGLADPMDIIRGLESGADNYITKPYERAHLLARVRQVLENREVRRRSPGGEGVDITFLGTPFTITAEKEQILDLLVSSYEELVRTNHAVRQAEQRARFLAEATGVLAESLDAETILAGLARFAVPTLADVCVADLEDAPGVLRRVEIAHATPALAEAARLLGQPAEPPGDRSVVARVLRERQPLLLPDLRAADAAALDLGAAEPLDAPAHGLRSLLAVPLVARGHTLGALVFLGDEARAPFGSDELALARELARAAALAVDNARLYAEAQRATRARDDVLAIVSHDLRNPIHTIVMASSFLLEILPETQPTGAEPEPRRQTEVIRRSAHRANALIGDLLDVTRIEAGRLVVSARPADARELVDEAVHEAMSLAEGKRLRLSSRCADALPPVQADRARVAQLFGNLLGNAIKFTPAGGEVTVHAEPMGAHVRFEVRDTGPGIAAEHLPHLFDRYWQARETQELGTGLGLYIAKGIAEAHGGRLWAESEPGHGSAFLFTLPVAREE